MKNNLQNGLNKEEKNGKNAACYKDYLFDGKNLEDIVQDVRQDYEERKIARRGFELQWQLNMNFAQGNQYCDISPNGEIQDSDLQYFWQEKQVYNHLAPILETRLAKLGRVRPKMSVMPATSNDSDIYTAKLAGKLLDSCYQQANLDKIINDATVWSETCGTVFYKVGWSKDEGAVLGNTEEGCEVKEGSINITIVPPFELYPDSVAAADITDCKNIIHARAYYIDEIKDLWGKNIDGEDISVINLGLNKLSKSDGIRSKLNRCTVVERYERPCKKFPDGRLIIIAQNELLFIGELPYFLGENGSAAFPFVKQTSTMTAGSFWGVSIIERAISVQRAYNAVKNRKHEFLNRIAMGVLAVEDGAVDIDTLTDEGLPPGKVVVYRQGASPPVFMDTGRLPTEFSYEEDRLMNEFISISGVSEIMRNSQVPSSVSSGVGLQLLIEQDDTRLSMSAEFIRGAIKGVAKMILRLFKQFISEPRIGKVMGDDGKMETIYWSKSDITSDDVVFATENEMNQTPANKRNFIFDLLKTGLLNDENGQLSDHMRHKVLDMLGLGIWENARDVETLQIKKAQAENFDLCKKEIDASEIDGHNLHIREHIKFMLSGENNLNGGEQRFLKHIRHHKTIMSIEKTQEPKRDFTAEMN